MTVLTLAGKPINWRKPPKPNTIVMWSKRTTSGKIVKGSFRSICHLDRLDSLSIKKFGVGISVMQSAYNKGVKASAGSHDFSETYDVWISGVPGFLQQRFFRANGGGAYFRTVAQGFVEHIHYFCLPPRLDRDVSKNFVRNGLKVGYLVDGGWSLYGRLVSSSQIQDYYNHDNALASHADDDTWFPADIDATIFDLDAYIARQIAKTAGPDAFALLNSHGPLARLGGAAGEVLWDTWEANMRKRADHYVGERQMLTVFTSDTNKHGALPNFGKALKRIGGKGIDLIARRLAVGGSKVEVLKTKAVPLSIDGHDAYGSKVRVTFPSGKRVTFWLVQCNLGRAKSDEEFTSNAVKVKRAFGRRAIFGFDEIDEGDVPNEHSLLRSVFPHAKGFAYSGWFELSPVVIGPKVKVEIWSRDVMFGCPGKAKVTPARVIVETVFGLPRK